MKHTEDLKAAVRDWAEDLSDKLGDKEKLHDLADKVKDDLTDHREVLQTEWELKKNAISHDIRAHREERALRREVENETRERKEMLKNQES